MGGVGVKALDVEAGAGADIHQYLAAPRRDPAHRRLDGAVGVRGAVLHLIETPVARDVRRAQEIWNLVPLVGHRTDPSELLWTGEFHAHPPFALGSWSAAVLIGYIHGRISFAELAGCLLYTSDAADDLTRVDLGGRRII